MYNFSIMNNTGCLQFCLNNFLHQIAYFNYLYVILDEEQYGKFQISVVINC